MTDKETEASEEWVTAGILTSLRRGPCFEALRKSTDCDRPPAHSLSYWLSAVTVASRTQLRALGPAAQKNTTGLHPTSQPSGTRGCGCPELEGGTQFEFHICCLLPRRHSP